MKKVEIKIYIIGFLALLIGVFIYILARPDTYISKMFFSIVSNDLYILKYDNAFIKIAKIYLADFLWALSLVCFLYIVYKPFEKRKLMSILCTGIFGTLWEAMQFLHFMRGTGDYVDILVYWSAGFLIILLTREEGKAK
ncbi:MAG: hypothetical protein IKZ35_02145 [Clostridia bacterium]|nr:hypothetical protein [Clostridia bacterium]